MSRQLELLGKLLGRKRADAVISKARNGVTKGYASSLIDRVLGSSRNKQLKLRAAKGRAERAATLQQGLVPLVDAAEPRGGGGGGGDIGDIGDGDGGGGGGSGGGGSPWDGL